jgi:hypothetical protein
MGNTTMFPGNLSVILFVRICSVLYYQRLCPSSRDWSTMATSFVVVVVLLGVDFVDYDLTCEFMWR